MSIAENIAKIKAALVQINKRTQLVAVSKMHDADAVREALAAGQRLFGENRVQEAAEKFPTLQNEFKDLQLHLIGPLQTNKVKDALELFDAIQTVDREKLAIKISDVIKQMSDVRCQEFFLQVNTGEEPQKAGIAPQNAVEFVNFCHNDLQLNITGLMCIPPVDEPAFLHFGLLRNIASKLETRNFILSMGMSADYAEAAEMGSDYVRVGSAIFGRRN
jgi:pyridoxal phosphate enzyme (YggS family)